MLKPKDKLEGLDLTSTERKAVEKYKRWLAERIVTSRMRPFYEDVDREFPDLDAETREKLAENRYRKALGEYSLKARHAGPRKAE